MKPGDFLIGVLDLFAVLLPGALATWLVAQYIPAPSLQTALSFGAARADLNTTILVTALLVSSFTLGHFVFMISSALDRLYDRWRRRVKPKASDKPFLAATALYKVFGKDIEGSEFSTFKWAKVYVQLKAPGARVEIDRLEADSKFFRSLVVVSIAYSAHFFLHASAWFAGAIGAVLAVLSYYRYREQRWKMTELAYATAVIINATAEKLP